MLDLAPDKVYLPFAVTGNAVVSYTTISLLTPSANGKVTLRAVSFLLHLCTLSGPLLIARYPVLWCPDFPLQRLLPAQQRLPDLPLSIKILHALRFQKRRRSGLG